MNDKKPYLAFGNDWFKKYQIILIVLLHFPIIGNILRYILGIKTLLPILKITGSCFVEFRGLTKRRLVSYSGLVFSMAIYKAFKPYWWMLHYIDEFLTYCKVPEQFSFGFSTLTAYPDANPETSTVDGSTSRANTNETFSVVRAGSGNASNDSGTSDSYGVARDLKTSTTTNKYNMMNRPIYLFSTNIGSSATVTSITLSLYYLTHAVDLGEFATHIVTSNPASNTALAKADYSTLGSTSLGSLNVTTSMVSGQYYNITLSEADTQFLNKTGITKLGRRSNWDLNNTEPTWQSDKASGICFYCAESGTSSAPKLVIEYSTSAIKNHIGTAAASIKKHINTAAADIKKHIGTT